jgi:hypothetical protein
MVRFLTCTYTSLVSILQGLGHVGLNRCVARYVEGLGLYIESGAKPDKSNSDDGLHNIRVLNKLKDAQEARVLLKENSEAVQQMLEPSPPPRATRAVAALRAVEDAAAPAKPSNEQQETPSSSTDAPPKKKLKATPREPSSYKGERVAKYFVMEGKNILFFGTVGEYVTDDGENWWDINYDDDDSESVTIEELKKLLKTYSKKQHLDPNKETAKSKEAS